MGEKNNPCFYIGEQSDSLQELSEIEDISDNSSKNNEHMPDLFGHKNKFKVDIPFFISPYDRRRLYELVFGIYLTNNDRKMHGEPMIRRIAGRKGVGKREKQYAST